MGSYRLQKVSKIKQIKMKIARTKELKKIKITHNKKLFWIIILLLILLGFIIYFGVRA